LRIVFLLFVPALIFALTLKDIDAMPRSLAKDFYIWLFLQQNVTPDDAKKAFSQVQNKNRTKVLDLYLSKVDDKTLYFKRACQKMPVSKLASQSAECIDEGFSVYKAVQANDTQLLKIFNKTKNSRHKKVVQILSVGDVYENTVDTPEDFTTIFNGCGSAFRAKHFNRSIEKEKITALARHKSFSSAIKHIVLDENLKLLQRSLLFAFDGKALSGEANFYLALNALHYDKLDVAKHFFEVAQKNFYYRFDKDKAIFWLYKVTEDENYLQTLSQSFDINIYSLYAKEKLNVALSDYEAVKALGERENDYDYTNPIHWFYALEQIKQSDEAGLKKLAKKFKSDATMGEYTFIMERLGGYKKHYFAMPFLNELQKSYTNDEIAFLYAVIRQESRFIPASISTAFALGKTQVMPFLVEAIAKEKNETIELTQMFEPQKAMEYGMHQIKYLKKHLHHPLIVAYAYNGGIGFTKRKIIERGLFEDKRFEPWLSMELVPYGESKRYGKKVLANYYVYKKLLNEPLAIESLIEPLSNGSKIARWR